MTEVRASSHACCGPAILALTLVLASSCKEPESPIRHEPMRQPPGGAAVEPPPPPPPPAPDEVDPNPASEPEVEREPLPERAPADPGIERALDLIASSGHTFLDPAEDEDEDATVYTAEQFASMLRSKWDWIGYDLTEVEPWLDEIATRSFKTNLPYLVQVDGQGDPVELRTWLDPQLTPDEP